MMPPTSIDGTDITGATIDGTDVTEITVDGQTVFTATAGLSDLVARSNLTAWYPFQANASFGGNELSDASALIGGPVGDSSAYDLTVNGSGVSHDPNDGVFDLDAGAIDTGSYESDGTNDFLSTNVPVSKPFSICFWYYQNSSSGLNGVIGNFDSGSSNLYYYSRTSNGKKAVTVVGNSPDELSATINVWTHTAITVDAGGNLEWYDNGSNSGSGSSNFSGTNTDFVLCCVGSSANSQNINGYIDDVRFYNKVLSQSEITTIVDNTEP